MSRKRKLDMLPSVEEMSEELERERIVLKKFRKYYGKMVGIALDQGGSKLSKLEENEKATWLIATCGFDMVATISRCIQSLPDGMTSLQRVRVISDCTSLPVDRARFLTEFIESHCPSLLETFKDNNFTPVTVLAPPVSTCYDCAWANLVSASKQSDLPTSRLSPLLGDSLLGSKVSGGQLTSK